jgi:hypothetical protein
LVELTEADTRLNPHDPVLRVQLDPLHQRQVDDQAVVADRMPGKAVPAAAHCQVQTGFPSKPDGATHIGRVGAPGHQGRIPVDRTVPDPAVLVVVGVARLDYLAIEGSPELVHHCWVEMEPVGRGHACHGEPFRGRCQGPVSLL